MKSKVYFIRVDNSDDIQTVKPKLAQLLEVSRILDFIRESNKVAVKIHFGEEGNTGYVNPEYARLVCENIIRKKAHCFLADTNTLYRGRRTNSQEHLKIACEHGFSKDFLGCDVVIADEKKENLAETKIAGKFIQKAKVVKLFLEADAIVGIAHFKGHLMTGFGGALKNIGMGCATREGKLSQHSDVSPFVITRKCNGCQQCIQSCLQDAILMKKDKAQIIRAKCIGCATCIAICPQGAIDVDWEAGEGSIQEKMVEYAKAVLKDRDKNYAFVNFATKITKECDCLAKDDPRIVPDVGVLASQDPVSIDKASLDLINNSAGRDIFRQAHPLRDGLKQLKYASRIGLGNLEYELVAL